MSFVRQENYTPIIKPYVEGPVKEYTDLQKQLVKDYDETVLMYDSLKEAADNLRSLDAEGDLAQKDKAFQLAYKHIEEAAKEGNYEKRGRIIRKAIKDFGTIYRPVQEKMMEREAFIKSLDDYKIQDKQSLIKAKDKLYKESGGLKQKADGTWSQWQEPSSGIQPMDDIKMLDILKEALGDAQASKIMSVHDELVKNGEWKGWTALIESGRTDRGGVNDAEHRAILRKAFSEPAVANFIKQQGFVNSVLKTNLENFENDLSNYYVESQSKVSKLIDNNLNRLKQQNPGVYNNVLKNGYNGKAGQEALKEWSKDNLKANKFETDLPEINNISDLRNYLTRDYFNREVGDWEAVGIAKYSKDEIVEKLTHGDKPEWFDAATGFGPTPTTVPNIGTGYQLDVQRPGKDITPEEYVYNAESNVKNKMLRALYPETSFNANRATQSTKSVEETAKLYRTTDEYKNLTSSERLEFESQVASAQAAKNNVEYLKAELKTKYNITKEDENLLSLINKVQKEGAGIKISKGKISFTSEGQNFLSIPTDKYEKLVEKNNNYVKALNKGIRDFSKSSSGYAYANLGGPEMAEYVEKLKQDFLQNKEWLNSSANQIRGWSQSKGETSLANFVGSKLTTKDDIKVEFMPKKHPKTGKPSIVITVRQNGSETPQSLFVPVDNEGIKSQNLEQVFENVKQQQPLDYIVSTSDISNGVIKTQVTPEILKIYPAIHNKNGQLQQTNLGDNLILNVRNGQLVNAIIE